MATFPIQVEVIPDKAKSGAKEVERELTAVEKAGQRLQRTLNRVFAFVGITAGLRQLVRLADTYTNIQNRIKTVTTGTEQLVAVTGELFKISNATRASYESTAEVYARTALAVKELGISQRQVLQFTQSLNEAVILSGASAREAEAGMIQLSQGLASGALRGDELRSVLEQLPVVADVIARRLRVTRGELRELGAQGKITAQIVLDAFKDARLELTERFAKTVPTIAQSFAVLRNRLIQTIGELDKVSGASTTVSKAILSLARNIDILTRAVIALGLALSVTLVKKGITAAIVGIKALGVAISAHPIGAMATAIVAGTAALISFSDKIKVSADGMVTLRDAALATFQVLSERVEPVADTIGSSLNRALETVNDTLKGFNVSFGDVLKGLKIYINTWIGAHVGLAFALKEIFVQIKKLIFSVLGEDTLSAISDGFKALADFIVNLFKGIVSVATRALKLVGVAVTDLGRLINANFDLPDLKVPDSVLKFGSEVQDAFLKGFNKDFVGTALDAFLPFFNEVEQRAIKNALIRIKEEKKVQDATKSGLKSLESAFAVTDRTISGFRTQINKYFTTISDLSTNLGKTLVNAFDSAADAFAEFVASGKFDFRSLADSIIKDIARIAIQQAVILPLLQGLGFGVAAAATAPVAVQPNTIQGGFGAGGAGGAGLGAVGSVQGGDVIAPRVSGRRSLTSTETSTEARETRGSDVTLIVNNYGNDEVRTEENTDINGRKVIVVSVAEDIWNEGSTYKAISGKFGITGAGA